MTTLLEIKQKAVSDYMARLGRKGGAVKGKCKKRSAEHYRAAGLKSAELRLERWLADRRQQGQAGEILPLFCGGLLGALLMALALVWCWMAGIPWR